MEILLDLFTLMLGFGAVMALSIVVFCIMMLIQLISYRIFKFNLYKFLVYKIEELCR